MGSAQSGVDDAHPDPLAVPLLEEKTVAADEETIILASGESDATDLTAQGDASLVAHEKTAIANGEDGPAGDGKKVDTPYIVGIGASAGGLEALEAFFRAMPTDSGIIFIVVTHLQPDQVSLLPQLIGNITSMPAHHIQDGELVHPNNIYIIPPGVNVGIMNRALQLFPRERERPSQPINFMFRALAQDHQERSIAIVLSGTGSDGAEGIRAIKSELGMVMVQEPESARFSGMPLAAIGSGLVDFVLPPDSMPEKLLHYVNARERGPRQYTLDQKTRESLQKIYFHLRNATSHDFSQYKKTTILRRIDRRMRVHGLDNIHDYAAFLQRNEKEVVALFRELLIGVTDFFRDQDAFELLKTKVLPLLLSGLPESTPFRAWVPGVATGEEAYSNAIMLQEYMEEHSRNFHAQIFATDINEDAIDVARRGLYPSSIEPHISKERLGRFFTREDSGYRIKREIREMIIFSTQNLIKDPPFTKLDLICCRNLLIYLDMELQRKIIPLFHYSLKPDGILFLGSSESIGEFSDMFTVVDPKWKIFKRKSSSVPHRGPMDFSVSPRPEISAQREVAITERNAALLVERQLLSMYAPTSVVVNRRGDILYIHGRTGRYLEPAQGQPKNNVFEMAREGLAGQLPALIHKASSQKAPVRYGGLRVKTNGETSLVNVTVQQLPAHPTVDGIFLIAFDEDTAAPQQKATRTSKAKSGYINDLERELESTRENLQTTIEELQTSNEELRSMNEEYQSTNEELQSANEELETSREEMQSLNEELSSVNTEMQDRIDDMTQMHQDLQRSLDSLDIPSLFLDSELKVLRFTSQAKQLINLLDHDIGRPFHHISNNLRGIDLTQHALSALESRRHVEREVQCTNGEWFIMRITPYRPVGSGKDGVVIAFVDIHSLKSERHALELARTAKNYAQSVIESVFDMLLIVDEDLRVVSANGGFLLRFGLNLHSIVGKELGEIADDHWDAKALSTMLHTALKNRTELESVKVALSRDNGKMLVRSRLLDVVADGERRQILLILREA
ncbi:MAG: PAS domain-containing protein [Candidatus Hydrogenedentes bacterium]|nr:PAS domain-containing protein [Candidatus Hydrogenedentota bacterium]